MKTTPDHHDAELMLRVYDLRREPTMRDSRRAVNRDFWPATYEEFKAVASTPDHQLNAPYRQISTYWEMVYSFAHYDIVNPEFWIQSNGEGLYLYARVEPYLAQIRRDFLPASFVHAEWMATSVEACAERLQFFRKRVAAVLERKRPARP